MSHSSKEVADIATVSITEAAFEEALARVGREDGAPSAIEAATSVAAPLGNLVQQIAETLVTCESKSLTREAEKERQQVKQPTKKQVDLQKLQTKLTKRLKQIVWLKRSVWQLMQPKRLNRTAWPSRQLTKKHSGRRKRNALLKERLNSPAKPRRSARQKHQPRRKILGSGS